MTIDLKEIHLRDPFILTDKAAQKYYLYGTTGKTAWGGRPTGFDVYWSDDLIRWNGPFPAFRPNADFWSDRDYWAPEVHIWQGKYYMIASFKAEGRVRGTQILVANDPMGPFHIHSPAPVTPSDWECLDGTLYVDQNGDPWIVFCHEWVQVVDGEICCQRLSHTLHETIGTPHLMFKASESGWSHAGKSGNRVTDGPFLFHSGSGQLTMIWSSFDGEGYNVGVARSDSGLITGPWNHDPEPLFGSKLQMISSREGQPMEGGHGMLFRSFADELFMTIHMPNKHPEERPVLVRMDEEHGKLSIVSFGIE